MMEQLANIARQFFHLEHWIAAQPIGHGHINTTYRIDFERAGQTEAFVLQQLNHQIFRQPKLVMRNLVAVTDYLAQQPFAYHAPAPVATLGGAWLARDEAGNYWRAFPFLKNTYAPEGLVGPEAAYESARAFGAFSHALRDFPADQLAEILVGFHDTDQRWQLFIRILAENPVQRVTTVQAEIDRLYAAKPIFDRISALKKSGALPWRVTHNDSKAGNVLLDLDTHQAVAVIDLDTVMPGTLLSDFGDLIRSLAPDGAEDASGPVGLRAEVMQAVERGFLAGAGDLLTTVERQHLWLGAQWITGEQALRFLTDYLAGDRYYKTQYPSHNLVRARNQLTVLEELKKIKPA